MKKMKMLVVALMLAVSLFSAMPVFAITSGELGLSYGTNIGLGSKDVRTTIAEIIKVALGMLGIVAVVIILIGGFKWMTSGGSDEGATEAKSWIFNGVIGLAIILSAYALASFVMNQLVTATND